ncbi:MAG: sugar phosphate isomerase/epimerase family protein [Candidatus Merdivicinus sp.]
MAFKVGLQVYSVRDDAEKDLKGTLQKIKAMGYDGVELAGLYGNSYEAMRAAIQEAGLEPISAHVPLDEMLADPEGVLKGYAEIGCSYVAVPYLSEERRSDTEGFEPTLKEIAMLGEVAKKNGMVMLYHNHDFEFKKVGEEYALDYMYRTIPADLLQTELDTCWVNVGGEDPSAYVRKYAGRAPIVHLKDFYLSSRDEAGDTPFYELIGSDQKAGGENVFEFRPVGYGMQDFPSILKASEEAGAGWVIVEQDRPSMNKTPMECAKMSRDYLKTLGV